MDYPPVMTLEKEEWEILLTGVQNLSPCNHKELDIRIMYHCTLEDKLTVIIPSDTDILILCYMYLHFASYYGTCICMYFPIITGFYKPKKKFVNASKIHDNIWNAIAITLPVMFVFNNCDTVSYFYHKSKKAILGQVLKQEALAVELVSDLGEHVHLSETSEEKLKRISHVIVYGIYVLIYVLIFLTIFCSSSTSNHLPVIIIHL